ncbi:4-alpha-glucanotransferase [Endozoicomonas arenosclerae]|uniref:4-alpha-glucanotransferase n=1 Tax=Endozoicomonas arenosclerae TaxID=1633495 RepID=UPI0007855B66|nr:4-alpha-glucanotransferase [Endozoicomonas arenosclerae]
MSDPKLIELLAGHCGISGEYDDWAGNPVNVPTEYKLPILRALGLEVDSDEAIQHAINDNEQQRWQQLISPVYVFTRGQPCLISLHVDERQMGNLFKAEITLETGSQHLLTLNTGDMTAETSRTLDDTTYHHLMFKLPDDLPLGYHKLSLQSNNTRGQSLIIIAPDTCYEPEKLNKGNRIWGSAIQLYTLRTDQDWGMGDFSSLRLLAAQLAEQGADIVGLNPIHALYPANPLHCSPYSPSSRTYINPMYIDVMAVADFDDCEEARKRFEDPEFKQQLNQARKEEYVDYSLVAWLKFGFLNTLFEHFYEQHITSESPRGVAFLNFCKNKGPGLARHALYETIYEHYKGLDINNWGWPCWESLFQDPESNAVKEFASHNQKRIQYYMYLQWLAEDQLAKAQEAAIEAGMLVGIYRDLAVGVDSGSSDVWSNRSLYCLDAGVGAPPDGVAPQGQNWGLPPFNPQILRDQQYQPFIEMVQANMSHCGALRIDHVMGLLRLWWCPKGKTADFGAYVYYPLDDFLGIIKLESHRRQCLVFGEDLGTVPPEIEAALPPALFYSNEVALFECLGDHFTPPEEYKPMALTCISNHDIPPLKAWWNCVDLDLRLQLGIYDHNRAQQEKDARHQEKLALLKTLTSIGEHPEGMNPDDISTMGYSRELMEKTHYYLAKTASKITVLQLEEVLQIESPVNIPGTSEEYPNWRRKLTDTLENIFSDSVNKSFFNNLGVIRRDAV